MILTVIAVAVLAIVAGVQTYRLQGAQGEIALLEKDLDAAVAESGRCLAVAASRRAAADAQSDLAEACLQREEQYIHDAAEIAAILNADGEPETETAPAKQGVSDATRRAAAGYLNRPL
jgi:hypothetical protein